jgi:large subunit ribosomal protein L7e
MGIKAPESAIKKRATRAKFRVADSEAKKAAKAKAEKNLEDWKARAEKHDKAYAEERKALVDNRRQAKADGSFFVPPQPKLALIIRIRGTIGVSPKAKKVMQLFRLRQLNNATFVRLNEATIRMLRLIEPYVTYGNPTRETIQKLVYKRGFGKLNGQRIPIADNSVIAKGLKKCNIICCADLINEIHTVGPNFKLANNFLWPFKLNSPRGGFSDKTKLLHFMEGGESGDRGEKINALVTRML